MKRTRPPCPQPHALASHPARCAALASAAAVAVLALMTTPAATAQIAFSDVSQFAGVDRAGESYGASWGDLNGDGYPDLFASNHREQPSLFLNLKNGRFYETAAQVLPFQNRPHADTHGGTWADIDNDGDQDLLISTGTGNLSQLLVNEGQRLVDRTKEWGLTTTNEGGRLPVWLDYDGDKLPDFVMAQYAGIGKLYHQDWAGHFTETTGAAKLTCYDRFHYAQLLDVNNDGRLDFMCSGEATFPQKIFDTMPMPWSPITATYLPRVQQTVDSVIADFNNDGRMDLFVLGGTQLRQSGVKQGTSTHFESQLAGGIKGFKFVTSSKVKFDMDWNRQAEGSGTELTRIQIGSTGWHPTNIPFTLDPANTNVRGMPPKPTTQDQLPLMQIGYDATAQRWTLVLWTQLNDTAQQTFSEAYLWIDGAAAISSLTATGLWAGDKPAKPTLLMNYSGGFVDTTAQANLDVPMQCVSATTGDFDNDMDVDLYLACRGPAENLENQLYENLGGGTFRKVTGAGGAAGPTGIALGSGVGTSDSVVTADYNVDGFLDLFVTNGFNLRPKYFGGPNKLFRNKTGNGKHWIEIDLVGKQSDRDATGARIYATANGVRQLRVQNGSYHRWSQDLKRAHFGLAGATIVDLRIEWPSGNVQTFNDVPTNKLYRITEGVGIAPVALGAAPAYQCGAPPLDGSKDKGVFIWRDCPSGQWRLRTAAAGGAATYAGTVTSGANFVSVKGVALSSYDKLDYTSNPKQVKFTFQTSGSGLDGVNFLPKDKYSACLRISTPAGIKVYYGPFRVLLTQPLDLDSRGGC